jgi:hypothetical protein
LTDDSKFFYPKYKEAIFMTNMYQEIDKFLSGFIDGAVSPYFTSEKMV